MTNIGRIQISQELILRWLDFVGGDIKAINNDGDYNIFTITLAHADMPKVKEGDAIPLVVPLYITHQDAFGNRVSMRDKGG